MQPLTRTAIMYALSGDSVRLLLLLPDGDPAGSSRSMSRLTQGCDGFTQWAAHPQPSSVDQHYKQEAVCWTSQHPAAVVLAASGAAGLSCTLYWDQHSKHSQHRQGHTTQRQALVDPIMQPDNHTAIMYALYGDNVRLLLLLPDVATLLAHHDR